MHESYADRQGYDEEKVALDDPVEKYLPEFKGQMFVAEKDGEHKLLKKPAHPMTVRNLLLPESRPVRGFPPREMSASAMQPKGLTRSGRRDRRDLLRGNYLASHHQRPSGRAGFLARLAT